MTLNELLEKQKMLTLELDKIENEIQEVKRKHKNARINELCELMRTIYAEGVTSTFEINDNDEGVVYIDLDDLADEIENSLKWRI
jgi:hypothetical protein